MKIGVLGYGTVGKSVCDILSAKTPGVTALDELELKYILRRKGKADGALMIDDPEIIWNDPEIELVVDVLPGIHPSYEYIKAALTHGKNVVSANKAALACNFAEFIRLANEHHTALMYEAACGGAVPVIHEAKKIAVCDDIQDIYGILNGTSNYILYNMYNKGIDFHDALKKAQELGYAEADPTADIEGEDLRNKAVILADTAWNTHISTDIETIGITKISYEAIKRFEREGKIIKLMMLGKKRGTAYKVYVVPTILKKTFIEANVPNNFNIATIETEFAGRLCFYGYGAGGNPTASAILRDMTDILGSIKRGTDTSSLNPRLNAELNEDHSLFTGTVYIGDRVYTNANPHDYIAEAKAQDLFFAFEPTPVDRYV